MDNKFLDTYIDQLIIDKKIEITSKNELIRVKNQLKERIEDAINTMVLNELPEEKIDIFEKLLDANSSLDKINYYLNKNIENLDNKVLEVLLNFRNEYLIG